MRHPHSEATYRVVPFDDTAFAVEVTIPDTNPTRVSPFATESDAEDWIADHKRRVETQAQTGRWHRRSATRPA
jgi:hypothetical protein